MSREEFMLSLALTGISPKLFPIFSKLFPNFLKILPNFLNDIPKYSPILSKFYIVQIFYSISIVVMACNGMKWHEFNFCKIFSLHIYNNKTGELRYGKFGQNWVIFWDIGKIFGKFVTKIFTVSGRIFPFTFTSGKNCYLNGRIFTPGQDSLKQFELIDP